MDLKSTYNQINELINKVDFDKLWNGFKPLKFALYDDKQEVLNGNFVIELKDEIIKKIYKY